MTSLVTARAEVEAVAVAKADQHYHLWLIISKDKLINNPKYVCDVEIWNGIIPYGRIMFGIHNKS